MGDTEEGLHGGFGVCEILGVVRLQFSSRVRSVEHGLYRLVALRVVLHIEMHAGEKTEGCVFGGIALIAVGSPSCDREQGRGLLQVFNNLVIDLSYGITFHLRRSGGGTQRYARVVPSHGVGLGIERDHVQVHQRPYEIGFAQDLLFLGGNGIQGLDEGVGHVDDFIPYHPERTYVLEVIGHGIGGGLEEGVGTLAGDADVIGGKLRHLEPMTAISVSAGITEVFYLILHERVAAVHDRGGGVFHNRLAALLVGGIIIQITGKSTNGQSTQYQGTKESIFKSRFHNNSFQLSIFNFPLERNLYTSLEGSSYGVVGTIESG